MSLKLFLIGFLLCVATQTNCQKYKEFKEECQKELNYSGDLKQIGETATQADKCFVSCIMSKSGELKTDGTIDLAKTREAVDKCKKSTQEEKDKRFQAAQECATSVTASADLCDTAYKHYMCRKSKKDQ